MRAWWLFAAGLSLAACGDAAVEPPDSMPEPDGGVSDAEAPPAWEPAPPEIPWLSVGTPEIAPPVLTPCRDGWIESAHPSEVTVCEPWPEGTASECPAADMALFAGETACRVVGAECDASPPLPDGPKLYALPGASGGDGSLARPFGSVAEALGAVTEPTTIVLQRGVFAEQVTLPAGITLWGDCAALSKVASVVQAPEYGAFGTEPARVVNVGLGGSSMRGAWVSGGELHLEGVVVSEATGQGILVQRGILVAHDVVVRGTQTSPEGRDYGIEAAFASTVQLDDVVVEDSPRFGVVVGMAATTGTFRDLVIRGVPDGSSTYGLFVADGASVDLEGGVVEGVGFSQVAVENATLRMDQSLIRDSPADAQGLGLNSYGGATVELLRSRLERARNGGVVVSQVGTSVMFADVVVSDTQSGDIPFSGVGVDAREGSSISMSRAVFHRNRATSLSIAQEGTTASIEDVTFLDNLPAAEGEMGRGAEVIFGATATMTRIAVSDCRDIGVVAASPGTELTIADVVVRDCEPENEAQLGRGVHVQGEASITLDRALLDSNHEVGVYVAGGSIARLTDIVVQDASETAGRGMTFSAASGEISRALLSQTGVIGLQLYDPGDVSGADIVIRDTQGDAQGSFGRGIEVSDGMNLTLRRARLERNRDRQIIAFGAIVNLEEITIVDSLARGCATSSCAEAPAGIGVSSYLGASVSLTDFLIRGAPLCGVQVADGEMDLFRGEIRESTVGACVQTDSYDVARLSNEVVYLDNEVNLDARSLPVPAAASTPPDDV